VYLQQTTGIKYIEVKQKVQKCENCALFPNRLLSAQVHAQLTKIHANGIKPNELGGN